MQESRRCFIPSSAPNHASPSQRANPKTSPTTQKVRKAELIDNLLGLRAVSRSSSSSYLTGFYLLGPVKPSKVRCISVFMFIQVGTSFPPHRC